VAVILAELMGGAGYVLGAGMSSMAFIAIWQYLADCLDALKMDLSGPLSRSHKEGCQA
jgi:hypothetical protein